MYRDPEPGHLALLLLARYLAPGEVMVLVVVHRESFLAAIRSAAWPPWSGREGMGRMCSQR